MKIQLFSIVLLFIILGCGSNGKESVHPAATITYCIDFSDPKASWPTAVQALTNLKVTEEPDAAYHLRIRLITDMQVTPSFEADLPAAGIAAHDDYTDDSQFRSRQVYKFYDEVRKMFDTVYSQYDTTGALPFSECWTAISTELQVLAQDSARHRYLYIYSDGLEKSAVNMYQSLSEGSIDNIAALLTQMKPIPKQLQRIVVVFAYQPLTREDDQRFALVLKLYRKILEPRGAIVQIQTN